MEIKRTFRYELTAEETRAAVLAYVSARHPSVGLHAERGGAVDIDFVPDEKGFVANVEFSTVGE